MKTVLAEIITIGDEILYGQITDTNTQWMSAALDRIGVKIIRKSSVGDSPDEILTMLREAESRADIILMTGGLGPTKDDLTKNALAYYFDAKLVIHEAALQAVTEFFHRRGRELTELNRLQAALPENCQYIPNTRGTAPGMWFERNGKVFMSMPGVPHEMKGIMTDIVLDKLQRHFATPVIYHKVIRTVGIGESFLAAKIETWEDALPPHIKLAYLPSLGQVRLRLTAIGTNLNLLQADVQREMDTVMPLIAPYVYGYDDDSLESVVGQLLLERGMTLAIAESCSVGYISYTLAKIPGSSRYFQGGIIPYHNDAKITTLGVRSETIEKYGSVSEETVREMAERVREKFGVSVGVASSGIAGPTGGTDEKPVGTVWIACADATGTEARKLQLGTDRDINIQYTAPAVLNFVRQRLLNINRS